MWIGYPVVFPLHDNFSVAISERSIHFTEKIYCHRDRSYFTGIYNFLKQKPTLNSEPYQRVYN